MTGDDLADIATFGFRGEALASIGAVARLADRVAPCAEDHAWRIEVEGGAAGDPFRQAVPRGTRIEVRDLFFATPARLKFLRSDRAETAAITEVVRRLSLAHPDVSFTLAGADRTPLELPAAEDIETRAGQVLGQDFIANAMPIEARRENVRLAGYRRTADVSIAPIRCSSSPSSTEGRFAIRC